MESLDQHFYGPRVPLWSLGKTWMPSTKSRRTIDWTDGRSREATRPPELSVEVIMGPRM